MSSSYVCGPQSKEVYLKLLTRNIYICSLQFIKLLNNLLHVSCAHVYTRVYTITNIFTCIRDTICYNNAIGPFADAWGLRENKSRKTGFLRDCLLFLHPLVVSLSLSLSLSLSSFSSSPFTSSASRWRYIAFVSSLSTPTLKLNDGCIQQRERSHGNWMLLTCTPRFDESDLIAIQLLFNRCLLWMYALMITVQFNAAHDPSVK